MRLLIVGEEFACYDSLLFFGIIPYVLLSEICSVFHTSEYQGAIKKKWFSEKITELSSGEVT